MRKFLPFRRREPQLQQSQQLYVAPPRDTWSKLVTRFPWTGALSLRNGYLFVVPDGQRAIFTSDSHLLGDLPSGVHAITPDGTPFLFQEGGQQQPGTPLPFLVVFFVSTRKSATFNWGTVQPVLVDDAESGPASIRAYGTFSASYQDLYDLVDFASSFEGSAAVGVENYIRSRITKALARSVNTLGTEEHTSVAQILASTDRIETEIFKEIAPELAAHGIDLSAVHVHGMSLDDMSLAQMFGVELPSSPSQLRDEEARAALEEVKQSQEALMQSTSAVLSEFARRLDSTTRILKSVALTVLAGILLFVVFGAPTLASWHWLLSHPHRLGIQGAVALSGAGLLWAIFDSNPGRRRFALVEIAVAAIIAVLQIL